MNVERKLYTFRTLLSPICPFITLPKLNALSGSRCTCMLAILPPLLLCNVSLLELNDEGTHLNNTISIAQVQAYIFTNHIGCSESDKH